MLWGLTLKKIAFPIIVILIFSYEVNAAIELSGNFGYNKLLYGYTKQNTLTTRSYTSSLAFYFSASMAFELNYYNTNNIRLANDKYKITGVADYSVVQNYSEVKYDSYGVGLKYAFAPRGYPVRPLMSLGYAKKFTENSGNTIFERDSDGLRVNINHSGKKSREDSVFGSFQLQLRITNRLSLTGSVKTVFKAWEWDEAKNSLKYLVGFSWII